MDMAFSIARVQFRKLISPQVMGKMVLGAFIYVFLLVIMFFFGQEAVKPLYEFGDQGTTWALGNIALLYWTWCIFFTVFLQRNDTYEVKTGPGFLDVKVINGNKGPLIYLATILVWMLGLIAGMLLTMEGTPTWFYLAMIFMLIPQMVPPFMGDFMSNEAKAYGHMLTLAGWVPLIMFTVSFG